MPKVADPQRAAETEATIIEAAKNILAQDGLEALSMRAVGARVGLSATALYNYFENKQALVDRVVARGFRRFESYLCSAVEGIPTGRLERVRALGAAYIRFAMENEQYFKIMFTIQPEDPREIEELPGQGGRRIFRDSVADAIVAGEIREADPDLVALYLWSSVHGLATLSLACDFTGECLCGDHEWARDGLTVEGLYDLFGGLLADGLRPRDTGRVDGEGKRRTDGKGNGRHAEHRDGTG